uniref:Uncharacterized protein n=2 Tax=Micrurus carvalhoi TaxID=3147026 RepID=A0A2H6MX92_9SAUR
MWQFGFEGVIATIPGPVVLPLLAAVSRSFHSGKLTPALQYKHSNADANFPEFFQFVSVWQLPDAFVKKGSVILSVNHSCTAWFDVFSVSQDFWLNLYHP